jgi:hypothetical protein
MAARRKSIRRQPPRRPIWRVRYKTIEVDGFDFDDDPKVVSDFSDKCGLWVKVGQSMRKIRIWKDPTAFRFCSEDRTVGKEFEDVKMQ